MASGVDFGFVFESCKFISAPKAIPGKIYVKDFGFLRMRSICWPSLENEAGEDPDMMKNISSESDDVQFENISSQEVPYAFRCTQVAFWRPQRVVLDDILTFASRYISG